MITRTDPAGVLVEDYLARLDVAVADLPPERRADLLTDIRAHLTETAPAGSGEAAARRAMDELGAPETIADAARADEPARPTSSPAAAPPAATHTTPTADTTFDVVTVLLLLLGGFLVPVLGWAAGVIMLWVSPRWTLRDRLVGTLAWPVGIALVFASVGLSAATGSALVGVVAAVVVGIAFILVHVDLLSRARRRT